MILEACFKRRREGNKCCRKLKNKKIKGKSSLGKVTTVAFIQE